MEDSGRLHFVKKYAIELAYDGTGYWGWQSQGHGNTIQQVLEHFISKIFREKINILGCGRTDSGVHAKQYFAHFEAFNPPCDNFIFKLNSCLPDAIAVYRICEVNDDFHARFKAISRKYEYRISRSKNPFEAHWSYYRYGPLDVEKMNQAADFLLTQTDFKTFSKSMTDVKTYICKLTECRWVEENENLLVFSVKADRFLRNMVRAMVGTMLNVGDGKMGLDDLKLAMESRNRSKAGRSVPAKGLALVEVTYNWEEYIINEWTN